MPTIDTSWFEIRDTPDKGRGVFAAASIAQGQRIAEIQGWLARDDELDDEWFAMQVGPDLWLCSLGDHLDDCINHSCEPNAGFVTGEPVLFALRDIAAGEEIAWDYSTSIAEHGWSLDCLCGAPTCRGIVRSWRELKPADRTRLAGIALRYLRT
jgi:hypothetical protein